METAKGIIDYFPINELLFVLSAGIFIVISFPYDVFKLLTEAQSTNFFLKDSLTIIASDFNPFVNLHYIGLDNFVAGLSLIILSLIVGAVVYCSMGIFGWANRRVSWLFRYAYRKKNKKELDNRKKEWITSEEQMDFRMWIARNHLNREIVYVSSMRLVSVAFLYGGEILFAVTLLSGFLLRSTFNFWISWLAVITAIMVLLIIMYEIYESRYWRTINSYVQLYRNDSLILDYYA